MEREQQQGIEQNLPSQQFIDLQKKATTASFIGSNMAQGRFLLKAVAGISNGAFIINCLQNQTTAQTQTFKLSKTQVSGLLELVKKYYQSGSKIQIKKTMNKESDAFHKLDQMTLNFRQALNTKFDEILEFRKDFIENAAIFEEMLAEFLESARNTLIDAQQVKQYAINSLPKLRQKLKKEIEDILKCFLSKELQTQIEELANKIIEKPIIDCQQFLYQIKDNFREGILNRIITVIQNLDSYIALKNFDAQDINVTKVQFEIFFYVKFSKLIPFKILREMVDEFKRNPQYHFTNRTDLSDDQKRELIAELWLAQDSILLTLMKAYKKKETLQSKIDNDIQTILFYLIFTCKYNLGDKIQQIKENLIAYNLTNFFDQTEFVSNQVKTIYQFIETNCKDYMSGYNKKQCSTMQRITNQMKLKEYLNSKVQHIPYHHWPQIEKEIMNGNLNIIEKCISNEETISQLRQWANNNLSSYLETILKKPNLKDRVKNQIVQFLVKQGWKGLSFNQIDIIANDLLENPYFEVIEASSILTEKNKKDLKNEFLTLPLLGQYCRLNKIDLQFFEISARIKIQQEVNKLTPKINPLIKQRVIKNYLDNPKDSTVYEDEDLSQKWKKQFLQAVKHIPEVKTYIQNKNIVKCIKKRDAYLQKLQKMFKSYEFEIFKQHVCIYGKIPFNNEGKPVLQNCSKELGQVIKTLNNQNMNKLKQAQSSKQFQEFMDELPRIALFFKEECQARLIQISKKFYSSDFQPEEETQLANKIKVILRAQGASNLLNDPVFDDPRNEGMKTTLAQQLRFKKLVTVEKSILDNIKMFTEQTLKEKIKEIYDHQALMNIDSEGKTKMIQAVSANFQFQEIKKHSKINDDQKESLIKFIKESQQYKRFNQLKGVSPNKQKEIKKPKQQSIPEQKPAQKQPLPQSIEDKRNPEVKIEEKKPEVQERFVEQSQSSAMEQSIPIVQGLSKQQREAIFNKWDAKLSQYKEKWQYKNGKEKDYKEKVSQLVQAVLRGFPWSEETSVAFWKSGPKKPLLTDLKIFGEQNKEELKADCNLLFQ